MNSGIYRITHVSTGRVYVGQSVNLKKRFQVHKRLLVGGRHHSVALQRSWDKCGELDFEFEVLEFLPRCSWMLTRREQKYINDAVATNSLLNSSRIAGRGSRLGATASVETRNKISAAHKGRIVSEETRKNLSASLMGHSVSEAVRQKLSSDRKGVPMSADAKKKMSDSHRGVPLSHEHRRRISEGQMGKKMPPMADEHRAKISAGLKGIKRTPEQKERYRIAITAMWERRKVAACAQQ